MVCFLFLTAGKNVPMFMYQLFKENTAYAGLVGPHLQADAGYPWLDTRGAALS
jgi:hypothetical protein